MSSLRWGALKSIKFRGRLAARHGGSSAKATRLSMVSLAQEKETGGGQGGIKGFIPTESFGESFSVSQKSWGVISTSHVTAQANHVITALHTLKDGTHRSPLKFAPWVSSGFKAGSGQLGSC